MVALLLISNFHAVRWNPNVDPGRSDIIITGFLFNPLEGQLHNMHRLSVMIVQFQNYNIATYLSIDNNNILFFVLTGRHVALLLL